jgi:hypothetical protein
MCPFDDRDYDDDDEVAYICDDCGEEFPSQESLDGHEAEGCWAARS